MSNPIGIKKSNFVDSSAVPDSATFDFVSNGQNFKITFAQLKQLLGAFGQIKPSGAPTSTAILQQPSSTFSLIRGLEASQGVTATVSPQNGISLKTNLANAGTGVDTIIDNTAPQIQFKRLLGGDGVVLTDNGSDIEFSTTSATATTKTVIVSEVSDFPTAISGVITLEDNTDYFIANDISTSNRFVIAENTTFRGPASQIVKLEYTGVGVMMTGTNPNFRIDRVTVSAPNGTLLDIDSSGGGIFQIIESNIEACQSIGTIGDMFIVRIKGVSFENMVLDGLRLDGTGTIQILVLDTIVMFNNGNGATFFDFDAQKISALTMTNIVTFSTQPATFLSGLPNSGNINPGGLGYVNNVRTPSAVTPLSGITTDDALYNFIGNDAIPDTRPDGLLSFQTPTTTVIPAVNTPVLINGTWTVDRESQMTASAAGRITYNGEKDATLPIDATLALEPVSGSNKDLKVCLHKNGVEVPGSCKSIRLSSGSPGNIGLVWQDAFSNGDYYEIFVQNTVDAVDIQVNSAVFRVN